MNPAPCKDRASWFQGFERRCGLVIVCLVLLAMAAVRIRLRDAPLERDEGEYAYAAQLLQQGIPPYQLAYNMKFPGTYVAYALTMTAFGETPAGIRLGLALVTTLTTLMLYWLARKWIDETAGVVAAGSYAVLAASPNVLGLSAHATHFAAFFVVSSLCLLLPNLDSISTVRALAAGLLLGTATLMKQHAALFCVWGLVCVTAASAREKTPDGKVRFRRAAGFLVGAGMPLGVTCLILWRAGVFDRFWFWTIAYAGKYASMQPIQAAPAALWNALKRVLPQGALLWAIAASGLIAVTLDRRLRDARWILVSLTITAFLTTCPGFYFREHYFLLPLPVVAILGGSAVSAARRAGRATIGDKAARRAWWPVAAWGVALVATGVQNSEIWFASSPMRASRLLYGSSPFAEAETAADFIRTNSRPDALVAVLGSEPEIYFLCRRHSATGYIYMYPLMEPQPFAAAMQREMIRDIESNRPEFVVFVLDPISWLGRPESDPTLVNWWTRSYKTNYDLVGAVASPESGGREGLGVYRRRLSARATFGANQTPQNP